MKSNGKSTTPIIAANAKKNNGNEPAPPSEARSNGAKRVSRASKKAAEKMKCHVLERINDGIVAFDGQMNHVYVNEQAGEILGHEPQDLVGKNFQEVYPDLMGRPFLDACQRALETQMVIPFNGYFAPSDVWFEARAYPSDDGVSVLLRQSARSLQGTSAASYSFYDVSQFPEQNPNPVMRFTRGGELLYANPASAPLLDSWKGQTGHNLPIELQELLFVVSETGSNREIELENRGKTYSCLLVPVPESGYVNLYLSDITERKQAQESVNALIHQTTTGITRVDTTGKFVFVNQAFCEMVGYAEAELLDKKIWQINYPDDMLKNKGMFERLVTEGEPYQLEKRIVRRNGSTLWVTIGASPLRDATGQIYAAVTVVVDITRRKRAEESLLDSARRTLYLTSLSDALRPLSSPSQIEAEAVRIVGIHVRASRVLYATVTPDGTATIKGSDGDGRSDGNDTFNIHNYLPGELLTKLRAGRTIIASEADQTDRSSDLIDARQKPASIHTQVVVPLLREGGLVAALFVQQYQKRDWMNEEISVMEETAERMQTAIERARAEQELRESEKRFRILSNTVPSMVWSTAPDGTIQNLNEYWYRYTGLSTEESVANWKSIIHPEDFKRVLNAWNYSLTTGADYSLELRYRRYDGEYRWFQSHAIPARDEYGNIIAWYGVGTDIHDRMENEAELQDLINHTPFMLTRCTRDLRYRFVSRTYAEMIGRAPEEVAGKPIVEIMGETGFKTILPYVEQVLQGKRVEYETEVSFENIGAPALRVVYIPDYDAQGQVIGWFASILDLTERKRMENALRESEAQLKAELADAQQLQRISSQLIQEDNINLIYEQIIEAAIALMHSDAASMQMLHPEKHELELLAWKGFHPKAAAFWQKVDSASGTSCGESLRTGERVVVGDVETSDAIFGEDLASYRLSNIRSVQSTPLISRDGHLVGMISTHWHEAHQPSEHDLQRMDVLARQAADLIERRRADEALRTSEEKYRRIVETANEGIWEIDGDTRTVFVNRRMAEMLGYTPEEIIGHSAFEFVYPEDYSEGERRLESAKQGTRSYASEFRYRRKDGSSLWTLASRAPKLDEQGNFLGAVAMLTDITERKRVEDQLRELSQRLTYHVDNSPVAVIEWGPDMRLSRWSGTAERIFGWKAEEVLGKRIEDFPWIHKDDMQQVNEVSAALQTGNNIHRFSANRNYRKDGSVAYCEWYNSSLMDESGKLRSILSLVLDVTERKRAEEEIHDLNTQLQSQLDETKALLDILPTGVWIGNEDCSVITGNIAAYKMTGLPSGINASVTTDEPQMPASIRLFVNGEEVAPEDAPMQVVARSGKPLQNIEHEFLFENGTRKSVYVSIVPLFDAKGNVRKVIGAYTDITERKQAEQTLARERILLERLFDTMPVMVSMYDPEAQSMRLNAEFERTIGWKSEEISAVSLLEALYPDPEYRSDILQRMAAAANTKEWVEVRVQTRDGRMLDSLWSNISIMKDKQLVTGVAIGIDITERKRMEQDLEQERELLNRIIDSIPVMLTVYEPSTNVLRLNAQFERLTGWNNKDAGGTSLMEACYPDPEYREIVGDFMATSRENEWMDIQMQTRDGRTLETSWSNIHLSNDMQVGIGIDITERKQGERALVEYARQQSALYKLVDQLHRADTLEDVFNASLDAILSALQCNRASILLFDETEIMHFAAWRGLSDEYRKATDGHSPWKYGEENPVPIWYDDVETSDLSDSLKTVVASEGIGSLAFIPLVYQEQLIGKFMVYFNTPHIFTESEINLSLTIARQLASGVDRKRAEERLRTSEDRLRLAVAAGKIGIWDMDLVRRNRTWSKEGKIIYGLTEDEDLDLDRQLELTHPEDRAYVDESVKAFRDEGTIKQLSLEHRILHPDGSVHWVEVQGEAVYQESPLPVRLVGTIVDITERKLIEQALRQSEERFAQFMQYLPGLAWIKDVRGRYVFANAATERAFGVERDELYGKIDGEIFAPEVAAQLEENDEQALSEAKGIQVVEKLQHADGTLHYSLVTKFPIPGVDGKPALIGGTAFDITEQRQMEFALRESEERYRALVNQATAGIVRKDAEGRLIFVNNAFCEMLGYTASELTEKTMWQIVHPDDVGENRRLYNRLITEGVPFQLEKRLIRRNGSIIWATVSVSPVMDARNRPESAVSVYVDVTERKQAESRLALLAEVSDLVRRLENPVEVMSSVAEAIGRHFQVKRCLFNEIDIENNCEIVHRDYHDGVESVAGTHKLTDYSSITTREMIEGKTVVNFDSKTDPRTAPDYERSYVPNGERTYVAVPLMREDRWVASLWISDDKPRRWSEEEVALLQTIAERTWTATEKLRIHTALRDSEERLRVTFNTTAVGFATLKLDTRFLDVNDAFAQIVGYSREELLEMNCDALTHPDYLESTSEHVAQLIAGEIPSFVLEKIYICKDQREIWVQNSVSIVRDADGNPLHLIAIIQDITERKRTQDALQQLNQQLEERVQRRTAELQAANEFLRESEATSRLILESMPDAIIIADKQGRIVYGNTQVETLFGYPAQEVIGRPVETLVPSRFHGNDVDYRLDYAQNPNRRHMGLGRDLFGQRKDQSEFPVDVMLSPISNNTNWEVMVTIRDNTEQKQAQQALRANEEKLRKLFQVLPVGISFLDNEGRITEMNSALTEILGLSKHELLEGNFRHRRYIRSDGTLMPSSEFASIRAAKEHRPIYNVETGILKEDGQTIWTSVNAAPVDIAEVDVVVATIDITERKKAEEALHKHRERLRILSRRLVEVQEEERRAIARELHDRVGQNLAALNLNLNILRSQLTSTALLEVGQRLSDSVNLVNQILTITRNVMGDLRSDVLDDYGLEAALREYAEQFSARTGVQVLFDKSAKPIPRTDPSIEMTLLRIAQEALTNVAKHAQGKQASVSISADTEAVYMSIQDDGIGILSWQRANQPGSHGLRIIRERAEAFGGSLQVQSTYKKGTRIDVKIPLGNLSQSGRVPREKRS